MAKSMRSKWKKAMKRIKAKKEAPRVAERISKLHDKLELAAHGGLSKVPMVEPVHGNAFIHSNPKVDTSKPLVLDPLTTRVVTYGVDRPTTNTRPHSQHPSRQPDRFKAPGESKVMTEEEAAETNYGEIEPIEETDDGPVEMVLGFGSEQGLITLASSTRKPKTGKKFGAQATGTRVKTGSATNNKSKK
jgi:hypothetical protein